MCLLLSVNMRCVLLDAAGVVVEDTAGAWVEAGESGASSQIAKMSWTAELLSNTKRKTYIHRLKYKENL